MKTVIAARHMEVSEFMLTRLNKKLSKLDKFFGADAEAQVRFSATKKLQICEITIPIDGGAIRGEDAGEDMYVCIDQACEKLERQILKHKTKLSKRLKGTAVTELAADEPDEEEIIVRRKTFSSKPLDVEEAKLQMDLTDHSFYAFRNAETGKICVLYRRNDGGLGLLEPDDE